MNEYAERYRRIASDFTATVNAVPVDAWDNQSPVDAWVARDVVRHLVEWVPGFFSMSEGVEFAVGPSADDDPAAAWAVFDASLQAMLDDPDLVDRELATAAGQHTFGAAVDMFCTNDVFLHRWDLARATGLDERLDPDEVHSLFVGMEPLDDMLRKSGQYGERQPVGPDADEQTQLLAFIGRKV